jgi:dTDP-4-dehydrorhamnose reductase
MTQCRATVLAMRAIRAVNPDARLIQTEDLGRTWSTPALAYQADFENERRWLSFDLLHGRLDRDGPVWSYLRWLGVDEYALRWFEDNPCPPDVLGINTYMTSERFLDERVGRYPPATHGGNMRDAYADVEAVRVRAEGLAGARALLGQTWARYRRPVAITEAHLGCTREEQLRWLLEIWEAARAARADGADVRAVTVWSVFGAVDWDSLLTLDRRSYEPGVFDLRAPEPRPTALAGLARSLARGEAPTHPVLAAPGWWRRPVRFAYGFAVREDGGIGPVPEEVPMRAQTEHGRPLLITGATGTLGRAFARLCELRGLPYRLTRRADMDIADPASVAARLDADRPWAAINAAGYVRVDDAERERDACFRENTDGPAILAAACAARGIALVTFSSDLVFDGTKGAPYVEGDPPNPLNVYGESKAAAERRVLAADPSALVIRTSAFFGPWDAYNFVTIALRTLAEGRPFEAASDGVVSPTYVPDLVHATLDLLVDGERGIWHLANRGSTTWADLARLAAERAGLPADLVKGRPTAEFGWPARRPTNTTLASERADIMPSLEHALERFLRDSEDRWLARAAPSPGAPPTVQSSAVG